MGNIKAVGLGMNIANAKLHISTTNSGRMSHKMTDIKLLCSWFHKAKHAVECAVVPNVVHKNRNGAILYVFITNSEIHKHSVDVECHTYLSWLCYCLLRI